MHSLGVLSHPVLLPGIENVSRQGFSCVILIHPNHQWMLSILSLSEHNLQILYYLASTKDVFHCPISWNNVLYHMITTFKSLTLTAIRKNNVTSRKQNAFKYIWGILQLVNSFFFFFFSPLAYTRNVQRSSSNLLFVETGS